MDSGEHLLESILGLAFDVIVLDLNTQGSGGLEVTERLLAHDHRYRIVGVSTYTEGPFPRRFLALGGLGYVSKDADTDELTFAIHEAANGRTYISRDVAHRVAVSTILRIGRDAGIENLTRREIDVLRRISHGDSTDEIATQMSLSIKTIAYHRRRLLDKLGASNDVKLTLIARSHGLDELPVPELRVASNQA